MDKYMNRILTSRRALSVSELVNIVIAIWVAISPFILGVRNFTARWSNLAVGIALLLVALATEWIDEALESLVVLLAIWLFVSPFLLGFSTTAFLANNIIMAFVVVAAGATSDGLRTPRH